MALPSGAGILQIGYADRRVRRSRVFHDFASLGVPDAELTMPYSLWAFDSPDGVVLVDTGFDVAGAYWAGDADWRTVPEALDAVGIDPADVAAVLLSHLHFDHAGSLDLFRGAHILLSRREHEHWTGRTAEELRAGFVEPAHLEALGRADRDGRLVLIDGRFRATARATMIPAPGHTPGQMAVVVDAPGGRRILASDSVHLFEQLEHGWRFFAHDDAAQSDRSIGLLRRISAATGAPIVPGHDIRVREQYPALPGAAEGFATILA
ncbi:MAG: N-acyl homoserine lactonase family protein [Microbacteriaceae bacterium]|nr:N-acyl homoserine lactonase family protein [Microbacteriaceae bacterium]